MALTLKAYADDSSEESAGLFTYRPNGLPARRIAEVLAECRRQTLYRGDQFTPILEASGGQDPSCAFRVPFPSLVSEAMAATVALNRQSMSDMALIALFAVGRVDVYSRDAAQVLNAPDRFVGAGMPEALRRPLGATPVEYVVVGLGHHEGYLTIVGCYAVRATPLTQAFFPGDACWSLYDNKAMGALYRGPTSTPLAEDQPLGGRGFPAMW